MELHEVTEIAEIASKHGANRHLQVGWKLLGVLTERDGESTWFKYSLGWAGPLPAKLPEENY